MLTIFTSPKPFTEPHISMIQRNAIGSWLALKPACEVILFGNDAGVAETAADFGVKHVPDVECNSEGLPLVRDLFNKAEDVSNFDILTYINADIILLSDFTKAVGRVKGQLADKPFLMVGQRCDLEITEPIDFKSSAWEDNLREQIEKSGSLHGPEGIDYFVFPRGLWATLNIPPLVIGRVAYDNWLIYYARSQKKIDVIDATDAARVVHQEHAYPTNLLYQRRQSSEALEQLRLAGGNEHLFNITDANLILTQSRLVRPALTVPRLKRIARTGLVLYPKMAFYFRLFGKSISLLRKLRLFLRQTRKILYESYAKLLHISAMLLLAPFKLAPVETLIAIRQSLKIMRRMDYKYSGIHLHIDTRHDLGRCLWSCRKEPETVKWIEKHVQAGDVLYDVGANVGAYSLVAAKHTKDQAHIYAFEPSFSTFANLCQNIHINNCQNTVTPLPIALSDVTTIKNKLHYSSVLSGAAEHALNMSVKSQRNGFALPVMSFRIDDLIERFELECANYMKIDVDGNELKVLKGAEKLLGSYELRSVLIELGSDENENGEIIDFLKSKGLDLYSKHKHLISKVSNCIFFRGNSLGSILT